MRYSECIYSVLYLRLPYTFDVFVSHIFKVDIYNDCVFFLSSLCFILKFRLCLCVCVCEIVSVSWVATLICARRGENAIVFCRQRRDVCILFCILLLLFIFSLFIFGLCVLERFECSYWCLCEFECECFFSRWVLRRGNFHFKFVFSLSISTQIEVFTITATHKPYASRTIWFGCRRCCFFFFGEPCALSDSCSRHFNSLPLSVLFVQLFLCVVCGARAHLF